MTVPANGGTQVTITLPFPLHSLHLSSLPVGPTPLTTSTLLKPPVQTNRLTQPVTTVSASHLASPYTKASQNTSASIWTRQSYPSNPILAPQQILPHLGTTFSQQPACQALADHCAQPQPAESLGELTRCWMSLLLRSCTLCPSCCPLQQAYQRLTGALRAGPGAAAALPRPPLHPLLPRSLLPLSSSARTLRQGPTAEQAASALAVSHTPYHGRHMLSWRCPDLLHDKALPRCKELA